MIVLDSDHLSVLKYQESPLCRRLLRRMETSPDQNFATTIVCVEEQMRGWLALIHRRREALEQVRCYLELDRPPDRCRSVLCSFPGTPCTIAARPSTQG